jgi:hypothetical protein
VQLLGLDRREHVLVLVLRQRIGQQVAEGADVVLGPVDRLLQRARRALGRQQVVDLIVGQPGPRRQLVAARLAARLPDRLVVGLLQAREVPQRPIGQHHRSRQLGHELLHRLAHPPRRVAPERHAALGIEALERAQQPDDALLQQLQPLHLAAAVGARDRRDERHERLDEAGSGGAIAALGREDEPALVVLRQRRSTPEVLDVLPGDRAAHGRAPPHVAGEIAVEALTVRDLGPQLLRRALRRLGACVGR